MQTRTLIHRHEMSIKANATFSQPKQQKCSGQTIEIRDLRPKQKSKEKKKKKKIKVTHIFPYPYIHSALDASETTIQRIEHITLALYRQRVVFLLCSGPNAFFGLRCCYYRSRRHRCRCVNFDFGCMHSHRHLHVCIHR